MTSGRATTPSRRHHRVGRFVALATVARLSLLLLLAAAVVPPPVRCAEPPVPATGAPATDAPATDATTWRSGFPYVHDPVPFRHAWERVRVEEREWSAVDLVKDARYLTKMSHPMTHSSTQVEEHFARANALGPAALEPGPEYDPDPAGPVLRLGLLGDVMYVRHGTGDVLRPALAARLAACDLVAANLETPVVPALKPGMVHGLGLRFNASPDLLDTLATGGTASGLPPGVRPLVDVLGVTNNHALDRGPKGLTTTMFEAAARGMRPVGVAIEGPSDALADPEALRGRYVVLDRGGLRVAVTAFAWGVNHGCVEGADLTRLNIMPFGDRTSLPDFRLFERVVAAARAEGAELVVLMVHWGYEYEFFPEPHVMRLAREFAARGADLVVGSGPHVLQPLEVLQVNRSAFRGSPRYVEDLTDPSPRTCLVAYSLGNVVTSQSPAHCRVGALLSVDASFAVEGSTGRRRAVLTDARLSLTYTERRLDAGLPPRRLAALYDAAWALSPSCPDPGLARRVRSALDAADPSRLGAAWFADDERPSAVTLAPSSTDAASLPDLLVEGSLTPLTTPTGPRAVLKLTAFETTDDAPLPAGLTRRLAAKAPILVDLPEGAGPARTVRGTLVVTPSPDGSLTGRLTPLDGDPAE